ncbi:hypothetical protein JQ604_29660 [Bradyrhizobium jicamae]|uniref:hypothetical protein n=1 Tax=Bradyrhizobium jicamae TaxID=280332 RepID=UPI001BAC09F2|nr:hypothetical protein [Bradyrhizobium jicamae]MBR0756365.1 hypothetical protein [Bradyrhizobium jicamae]
MKKARVRKAKAGTAPPTIPPSSPQGAGAAGGEVSIRMYRGLLGDFFFVQHKQGPDAFKMLIDCGVLQCIGTAAAKPSTSRGKGRIVAAATAFMKDCGGSLDLVVATHEHFDHLSGFIFAKDVFANLKIGRVWMAWTEDRTDKVANGYRNKKGKALAALTALAQNSRLAATSEIATVNNLLQFYGGPDHLKNGVALAADGALPGRASCEAVLEWLRQKAGAGNVAFLKPGEVVRWGVKDGFRAYVLGPPRDNDKLLRQLDPSKGAAREVYLARGEDVETVSGLAAIHGKDGRSDFGDQPFVSLHRRPYDANAKPGSRAGNAKSLKKDPVFQLYRNAHDAYRRIDAEWLGSAEDLALKIDGDVNNTSLALALELSDKRILLFPGDAQVGNWLSWGDQTYPADEVKDGPRLKVEELLARAVFYKVGHHASHNATLRERGLELMTDPRLCAMIPVVEETAHEQKTRSSPNGWAMPYGDLYSRLNERTKGRILRGDGNVAAEKDSFKDAIFKLTYESNSSDPLWCELALALPS